MTVEQALVYLLAAVAGLFLFLGLAQALEDRPGRAPRRLARGRSAEMGRASESPAAVRLEMPEPATPEPPAPAPMVPAPVIPTPMTPSAATPNLPMPDAPMPDPLAPYLPIPGPPVRDPASGDPAMPGRGRPDLVRQDPVRPVAVPPEPATSAAVAPAVPEPGRGATAHAESPRAAATTDAPRTDDERPPAVALASPSVALVAADLDLPFFEACIALCLAGKYHELLTSARPRLGETWDTRAGRSAHVKTGLWSLVGLARHGRGDADGARAAFEAGLGSLPSPATEACPPRVAALSVSVARRLLDLTERTADGQDSARVDERIAAARLAAFWLGWRLVAAPGDQGATALLDTAREALAEGHAEVASAMIRRQEFPAARRFVERALQAGELPSARGELLLEFLGASLRREVERLTAPAMRGTKDESRAVTGLGRAEALVGAMPDGSLGPSHRAAVTGRIWRGHAKLGSRRLRLGQLDAAANTLFHALGMREIGRRRQRQVREALVRTLEGLAEQRSGAVTALLAEGNQAAAEGEIAGLERLIHRAREEGVSADDLELASGKVQDLRRRLVGADVPP